jgi:nicotinamidase-related amidase
MLNADESILLLIDIQGNLAQSMHDKQSLFKNLQILVKSARILELPIVWMEQIPEKLGHTVPAVAGLLRDRRPLTKTTFSCCGDRAIMAAIEACGRRQMLVTGIETHICVYQSTRDLLQRGFEVHVISDAVSSRVAGNKNIGLARMRQEGALISSVEMALFEMLREAAGDRFRQIVKLLK